MRLLSIFCYTSFCALISLTACHSAKTVSGDNKEYPDDSLIDMKTVERKAKMPFDTAAPIMQKRLQREPQKLPKE